MSATLYRQTNVGQALVDALDQMVEEGKIPGPLAHKVVEQVGSGTRLGLGVG